MNDINKLYDLWRKNAVLDPDLGEELEAVEGKEDEILDRFYKDLEFGTGGLRGVIGAGCNRMNVYTVGKATQGLADFLNSRYENARVAIAYDSRIKSEVFAKEAAGVLAANGIRVFFFPTLVPTPVLSFAVRRLKCQSGIVITASHNPSKYNGYKCYDPRGYQMTDEAAAETYEYIKKTDPFTGVKRMSFDDALAEDMAEFVEGWLLNEFYDCVQSQVIHPEICKKTDLKIIYTPLNGTGNRPVRTMLTKIGIKNVKVVAEQELPDGKFPTCPFPNPEIKQVFEIALDMAKEYKPDLLLATDPDCDRVGIAVPDGDDYRLLSGNEVGAMLTQYVLSQRQALGTLPESPVILKSFVTTELVTKIAEKYGAKTVNLLTGFKYTGEYITALEEKGESDRFVLGMEESYGYLSGTHARDKDAVLASTLIVDMAAYYKSIGIKLVDVIEGIYSEYGMYLNTLLNFGFEGAEGMAKMAALMDSMRKNAPAEFAAMPVITVDDYLMSTSIDTETGKVSALTLPKSNVLSYTLPDNCSVIIRPSGTEPKIKVYLTACAADRAAATALTEKLGAAVKNIIGV